MLRKWIIWTVSLLLCLNAVRTIRDLLRRQDSIALRKAELERVKQENRMLERELNTIAGDAYVEKVARDKLGLVKDGETLVILSDPEASGEADGANGEGTNWKRWYRLFF